MDGAGVVEGPAPVVSREGGVDIFGEELVTVPDVGLEAVLVVSLRLKAKTPTMSASMRAAPTTQPT